MLDLSTTLLNFLLVDLNLGAALGNLSLDLSSGGLALARFELMLVADKLLLASLGFSLLLGLADLDNFDFLLNTGLVRRLLSLEFLDKFRSLVSILAFYELLLASLDFMLSDGLFSLDASLLSSSSVLRFRLESLDLDLDLDSLGTGAASSFLPKNLYLFAAFARDLSSDLLLLLQAGDSLLGLNMKLLLQMSARFALLLVANDLCSDHVALGISFLSLVYSNVSLAAVLLDLGLGRSLLGYPLGNLSLVDSSLMLVVASISLDTASLNLLCEGSALLLFLLDLSFADGNFSLAFGDSSLDNLLLLSGFAFRQSSLKNGDLFGVLSDLLLSGNQLLLVDGSTRLESYLEAFSFLLEYTLILFLLGASSFAALSLITSDSGLVDFSLSTNNLVVALTAVLLGDLNLGDLSNDLGTFRRAAVLLLFLKYVQLSLADTNDLLVSLLFPLDEESTLFGACAQLFAKSGARLLGNLVVLDLLSEDFNLAALFLTSVVDNLSVALGSGNTALGTLFLLLPLGDLL